MSLLDSAIRSRATRTLARDIRSRRIVAEASAIWECFQFRLRIVDTVRTLFMAKYFPLPAATPITSTMQRLSWPTTFRLASTAIPFALLFPFQPQRMEAQAGVYRKSWLRRFSTRTKLTLLPSPWIRPILCGYTWLIWTKISLDHSTMYFRIATDPVRRS